MSDAYDDSYDPYGDTDPNNVPDGAAGQDTSAGDGLAGVPVQGMPGWRAGVFRDGRNVLGLVRMSDLVGQPADGGPTSPQFGPDQPFGGAGDPRLMLVSDSSPKPGSGGAQGYPLPPAYTPDGHGGVQLRPGFAATHPKGPFDFAGMSKEIDWPGVAFDLGSIAAGALPLAGAKAADVLKATPGMALDTWRELQHDMRPGKDQTAS